MTFTIYTTIRDGRPFYTAYELRENELGNKTQVHDTLHIMGDNFPAVFGDVTAKYPNAIYDSVVHAPVHSKEKK